MRRQLLLAATACLLSACSTLGGKSTLSVSSPFIVLQRDSSWYQVGDETVYMAYECYESGLPKSAEARLTVEKKQTYDFLTGAVGAIIGYLAAGATAVP